MELRDHCLPEAPRVRAIKHRQHLSSPPDASVAANRGLVATLSSFSSNKSHFHVLMCCAIVPFSIFFWTPINSNKFFEHFLPAEAFLPFSFISLDQCLRHWSPFRKFRTRTFTFCDPVSWSWMSLYPEWVCLIQDRFLRHPCPDPHPEEWFRRRELFCGFPFFRLRI